MLTCGSADQTQACAAQMRHMEPLEELGKSLLASRQALLMLLGIALIVLGRSVGVAYEWRLFWRSRTLQVCSGLGPTPLLERLKDRFRSRSIRPW